MEETLIKRGRRRKWRQQPCRISGLSGLGGKLRKRRETEREGELINTH